MTEKEIDSDGDEGDESKSIKRSIANVPIVLPTSAWTIQLLADVIQASSLQHLMQMSTMQAWYFEIIFNTNRSFRVVKSMSLLRNSIRNVVASLDLNTTMNSNLSWNRTIRRWGVWNLVGYFTWTRNRKNMFGKLGPNSPFGYQSCPPLQMQLSRYISVIQSICNNTHFASAATGGKDVLCSSLWIVKRFRWEVQLRYLKNCIQMILYVSMSVK